MVDLEAIRKRVQELNGQRKTSSVQLWKPGPGEYKVRIVPWKPSMVVDGMPFVERRFYYLGDQQRIVVPPAGSPDPINALAKKLFSTRDPNDREFAKKLMGKMTAYSAIIVRGEEDKDVQVWSYNKFVYQRLLGFFTDTDINPDGIDYMDPNDGIDLIVKIKPSGKKFNNKEVMNTEVDLGRQQRKLSNDPVQAKKWLDNIPNVDDIYKPKTEKEMEEALNAWISGGTEPSPDHSDGTVRGRSPGKDALDELVDDVKAGIKEDAKKPRRKATEPQSDEVVAPNKSLKDAFTELMEDESSSVSS